MARYIDADELKKQIDLVQILVMGGRSQGKSLLNETMETYKKAILKKIDEQPTADVVPKSEVEEIVIQWKDEANCWQNNYIEEVCTNEKVRAEAAREIFEEIEKKVKASLVIHLEELNKEYIIDTPLYDRHSGILFALQGMDDFIAELKKKYTEDQT